MRARQLLVLIAALGAIALPAVSQLKLTDRIPDEPADVTYRERFSLSSAVEATRRIDRSLTSFRTVTGLARSKVSAARLKKAGNTDAEIQELGFPNWVGVVEGTLRKQHYEAAKLRYEVASLRQQAGKASEADVAARQKELKAAEAAFQRFWNRFGVAD